MKLKFNFSVSNLFLCNKILFDIKSFCYIKYNIFLCNRTFKVQLKFNFILKTDGFILYIRPCTDGAVHRLFRGNIIRDLMMERRERRRLTRSFRPRSDGFHGRECRGFGETRPGSKSEMKHTARRLYLPLRLPPKNGDTGKKDGTAKDRLERLKAKAEAQMEKVAPYLSDGFTDEEMYKAMISKGRLDNRPSLKWRPVKDKL